MSSDLIYFDHAAATPLDERVFDIMQPYLAEKYVNPSSLYPEAKEVRIAIETARWDVAQVLGAKKTEIVFTSGATESVNLALWGVLRSFPKKNLVISAIEHEAVMAIAKQWQEEGGTVTIVPVGSDGVVSVEDIKAAIIPETVLVSIMYASNEIGTIQPIAKIGQMVQDMRHTRHSRLPLYFHTDATQAANFLDLHVTRLGVDLLTLSGSKIYGPKGSGCLFVKTGTYLKPLLYGGGQEKGMRSGTENVAGVIGFALALQLAQEVRDEISKQLSHLRDNAIQGITASLPDATLNGDATRRLPNNINVTIPGVEGEALVLYLSNEGILASTGSACSTGEVDPSHVLLAIGLTKQEAEASLRLTFGRGNSDAQLKRFQKVLPEIVGRLRSQHSLLQ